MLNVYVDAPALCPKAAAAVVAAAERRAIAEAQVTIVLEPGQLTRDPEATETASTRLSARCASLPRGLNVGLAFCDPCWGGQLFLPGIQKRLSATVNRVAGVTGDLEVISADAFLLEVLHRQGLAGKEGVVTGLVFFGASGYGSLDFHARLGHLANIFPLSRAVLPTELDALPLQARLALSSSPCELEVLLPGSCAIPICAMRITRNATLSHIAGGRRRSEAKRRMCGPFSATDGCIRCQEQSASGTTTFSSEASSEPVPACLGVDLTGVRAADLPGKLEQALGCHRDRGSDHREDSEISISTRYQGARIKRKSSPDTRMQLVVGSPGSVGGTRSILREVGEHLSELYFAVKNAEFGSGRDQVYDLDLEKIADIKKEADPYGVSLKVAFNAPCYGAKQGNPGFLASYRRFLGDLWTLGIEHLILADTTLIRETKKSFPRFHVSCSSFCLVDNGPLARQYEQLGVDRIILPTDVNKRLSVLSSIRNSVSCELEVIANLACLHNCPFHTFHGQFLGHSCRAEFVGKPGFRGDYYRHRCHGVFLNYPGEFIKAVWIRPEDVTIYEDLGVRFIKLAGRIAPSSWVIRAVRAYAQRSFDGNLLSILSTPFELENLYRIDNKALDGFVEGPSGCQDPLGGARSVGDCTKECALCGACERKATDVVSVSGGPRRENHA